MRFVFHKPLIAQWFYNKQRVNALSRHPGYAVEMAWNIDDTRWFWVGFMPLGELRVPLDMFDGVDLSVVVSISIIFDRTLTGAVMMSGIYVK